MSLTIQNVNYESMFEFLPSIDEALEVKMHADLALRMMSDLLWTGLIVSLPLLGLTMLVGLLISVVQVVTQVQEMSLTFVPKLVMAGAVLLMFGPWMLRRLSQFATQLWNGIPGMF